jgi:hypothetical protein
MRDQPGVFRQRASPCSSRLPLSPASVY